MLRKDHSKCLMPNAKCQCQVNLFTVESIENSNVESEWKGKGGGCVALLYVLVPYDLLY